MLKFCLLWLQITRLSILSSLALLLDQKCVNLPNFEFQTGSLGVVREILHSIVAVEQLRRFKSNAFGHKCQLIPGIVKDPELFTKVELVALALEEIFRL